MATLRFAVATTPQAGAQAFDDLRKILSGAGCTDVEAVFVPSYGALFETLRDGAADAGWCPPLVARDLASAAAGNAVAAVVRNGANHYYSAIVASPNAPTIQSATGVIGRRVGWVSPLSAAGYIVPRSHLSAQGLELAFREERFFRTHARSMSALAAGAVDAVATYASPRDGRAYVEHGFEGARIVAAIGPIPGDVIVVATSAAKQAPAIAAAFQAAAVAPDDALAKLMSASAFGPVPPGHLEALSRWAAGPVFPSSSG